MQLVWRLEDSRGRNPLFSLSKWNRLALSQASVPSVQGSRTMPTTHLERKLHFAAQGKPWSLSVPGAPPALPTSLFPFLDPEALPGQPSPCVFDPN